MDKVGRIPTRIAVIGLLKSVNLSGIGDGMIKRFVIALVLVVLVCGGLVGFNIFRAKMINNFFATMKQPPVAISATRIVPVTWDPQIDAIGTLYAIQGVDVATQVSGVVESISFEANERVEKGQLLVHIDDAVERADLMSAESAVERDRAQLERAQTLKQSGVSSTKTLDDAQSALAASESSLAKIKATLDQKSIEAPFAGTIGIPRVDVGQYVQAGTVIATLQQLDTMKADFTVPEQQMDNLKMSQAASFGVAEDKYDYSGHITGIDPKVDPQTRMISVRAEVQNPKGDLRPGQFVRIRVALPSVENVIALPQTAVVTSLYGDYVYIVQPKSAADAEKKAAASADAQGATGSGDGAAGGAASSGSDAASGGKDMASEPVAPIDMSADDLVATQVFVKIGRRQGDLVEITGGLKPGQTVVTSGQNKLSNNASVTINNEVDPAAVALGNGDGKS